MESYAYLKDGKAAAWRVKLADDTIEYRDDGGIFQQEGTSMQTGVIHYCSNLGSPFDDARHRAAHAIWDAIEDMKAPKNAEERNERIEQLRKIWRETP